MDAPVSIEHRRHLPVRDEVAASDRRWLLLAVLVFLVTCALLAGAIALYRWTGPHPSVTLFLRSVKRLARRLVPGV
ncbi:MAG TPA: hypothetical protein VFD84_09140 [Candidatus Binatia bacterium]|nr:hypothetical protein [Candidatus Binatia bacterium]